MSGPLRFPTLNVLCEYAARTPYYAARTSQVRCMYAERTLSVRNVVVNYHMSGPLIFATLNVRSTYAARTPQLRRTCVVRTLCARNVAEGVPRANLARAMHEVCARIAQ